MLSILIPKAGKKRKKRKKGVQMVKIIFFSMEGSIKLLRGNQNVEYDIGVF